MATIATRIVKIGNSQGIRIPKTLLDQSGLPENVLVEVDRDTLVIRPAKKPREDWDAQFQQMATQGDDVFDDWATFGNEWDEDEWEW